MPIGLVSGCPWMGTESSSSGSCTPIFQGAELTPRVQVRDFLMPCALSSPGAACARCHSGACLGGGDTEAGRAGGSSPPLRAWRLRRLRPPEGEGRVIFTSFQAAGATGSERAARQMWEPGSWEQPQLDWRPAGGGVRTRVGPRPQVPLFVPCRPSHPPRSPCAPSSPPPPAPWLLPHL